MTGPQPAAEPVDDRSTAVNVVLLGGPFDGRRVTLSRCPERIEVAGRQYRRLNDPDTGEFLGGYAAAASTVEHRG